MRFEWARIGIRIRASAVLDFKARDRFNYSEDKKIHQAKYKSPINELFILRIIRNIIVDNATTSYNYEGPMVVDGNRDTCLLCTPDIRSKILYYVREKHIIDYWDEGLKRWLKLAHKV